MSRSKPITFSYQKNTAIIDNDFKLLELTTSNRKQRSETTQLELYNLTQDPKEENNLCESEPELAERMTKSLREWQQSLAASMAGRDYPSGKIDPNQPVPTQWNELEIYRPYFKQWKDRPEYRSRIAQRQIQIARQVGIATSAIGTSWAGGIRVID